MKIIAKAIVVSRSRKILLIREDRRWKIPGRTVKKNESCLGCLRKELKKVASEDSFVLLSTSPEKFIIKIGDKLEVYPYLYCLDGGIDFVDIRTDAFAFTNSEGGHNLRGADKKILQELEKNNFFNQETY